MFLARRPSPRDIDLFLDEQRAARLTYSPEAVSQSNPEGFNIDTARAQIGVGQAAFAAATRALSTWQMFPRGWTEVFPFAAPVRKGDNVAVLARHLGFWSLNACRIVEGMSTSEARAGFAYGTLEDHTESGQEWFSVQLDPADGSVWYFIRAVSRPQAPLAKLGYPVARYLQARFRRDSIEALRSSVERSL